MEYLNTIVDFVTNPWVGWLIAALFTAASLFLKFRLDGIKAITCELIDVAKAHKAATDPKGEAGAAYSEKERAALDKEFQDLIGAVALAIGKK
jgi:hypothetical protein